MRSDDAVISVPIVHLSLAVRSFTTRSIEPDTEQVPIARHEFGKLVNEISVVLVRISIAPFVSVPGRQIDAKF
ncbi:hypothetical protein D3C71_2100860 [compost metagenome]